MQEDGLTEEGIRRLVDTFYTKVRADPDLAPIFNRTITDWEPHLATMRDFWSSVALSSRRYKGNPVAAHVRLEGVQPQLFERWLQLFGETCSELFTDPVADMLRARAARIAESLKIAMFYRPDRPWPPRSAS